MTDSSFILRAAASGPVVQGTPGNVLTFDADGRSVSGQPAAGGSSIQSAAASILFDHVNGLRRFVVTAEGVLPGDRVWASLNGPCSPDDTDLVALGGAYASDVDQVTVLATYPGAHTSVTAEIIVYWLPAE